MGTGNKQKLPKEKGVTRASSYGEGEDPNCGKFRKADMKKVMKGSGGI